ncbi:MAG: LL-diaminopimelate aminotransferase [Oscillospiraceae bacterium]|nr:LL-diaminopimelate aminotransferase [Oscillospiraceae bacterium]
MPKLNQNFLNLKQNYLFIEISKRVNEFKQANPDADLIRMGIGDVTLPLSPSVVEAGKKAFDEMGVKETFRGYEDSGRGYDFLRDAVSGYYKSFGADVPADEIFISDGAKSDSGNISDIFASDCPVTVTDPAYPVYVDSNIMGGRKVTLTDFDSYDAPQNGIVYLCSPNNPTGEAYTLEQLQKWVDSALKNNSVIIYDAAYEAFITESDKPRSIFLTANSRKCAIEICSLSKTAGFTGTRCGYTVIPKEVMLDAPDGLKTPLINLWSRRQGSKFNGVSYPVQRAAEAVFTDEGQRQTREAIRAYQENAEIIMNTFRDCGVEFTGGVNSPYIWFVCPNNMNSWDFFDLLLTKANVVGTPGEGFGKNGKNRFRLTSFNTKENTLEAMKRFKNIL